MKIVVLLNIFCGNRDIFFCIIGWIKSSKELLFYVNMYILINLKCLNSSVNVPGNLTVAQNVKLQFALPQNVSIHSEIHHITQIL